MKGGQTDWRKEMDHRRTVRGRAPGCHKETLQVPTRRRAKLIGNLRCMKAQSGKGGRTKPQPPVWSPCFFNILVLNPRTLSREKKTIFFKWLKCFLTDENYKPTQPRNPTRNIIHFKNLTKYIRYRGRKVKLANISFLKL